MEELRAMAQEIKNQTKEIKVEISIYNRLPDDFDPGFFSFGCPIGHKNCGEIDEIIKDSARKKVFIAIPYSDYNYEQNILGLVKAAGLEPLLAKQKIQTSVVLCKICKNIRKCHYGIVDITKNNVNVAYELGLMQSLGRNCAILLEDGVKAQSDLQGLENVLYTDSTKLENELARWLIDNVKETKSNSLTKYLHKNTSQSKKSTSVKV
jgi:hypothetical protein